mgnify:CR=1 FL=1
MLAIFWEKGGKGSAFFPHPEIANEKTKTSIIVKFNFVYLTIIYKNLFFASVTALRTCLGEVPPKEVFFETLRVKLKNNTDIIENDLDLFEDDV